MPKTTEAVITADTGNWLLQRVAGFELPEKLGQEKYDLVQRGIVKDFTRQAFSALLEFSYWAKQLGEDHNLLFGSMDQYELLDPPKVAAREWRLKEAARTYRVKFTTDAVSGIMWMFYTMLVPSIKDEKGERVVHASVSPAAAELYIWPLVRQFNKTASLRALLGLDKPAKGMQWEDDPSEPEKES